MEGISGRAVLRECLRRYMKHLEVIYFINPTVTPQWVFLFVFLAFLTNRAVEILSTGKCEPRRHCTNHIIVPYPGKARINQRELNKSQGAALSEI